MSPLFGLTRLAASEGHNADAMKRRQPNPPVIRALAELVISPLLSVGRSEGWASGQREHLPNGKFRPFSATQPPSRERLFLAGQQSFLSRSRLPCQVESGGLMLFKSRMPLQNASTLAKLLRLCARLSG
jgi:hypothetical protein